MEDVRSRGRARLCHRRPCRRRGHRAADRHHAHLPGRLLGAFRLARRLVGDARLRSHLGRDVHRAALVRAQLAGRRGLLAARLRAARCRRQSLRAAAAVQRDLPRLRPRAEVAAVRQFHSLPAALHRRRDLPRHGLPAREDGVQPRLFRRSCRLRPLWPRLPRGDLRVLAGKPHRRAADPVDDRQHALVHGVRRVPSRPRLRADRGRHARHPLQGAVRPRPHQARDLRLQGRRLRAEIPGFETRLRARHAVRLHRGLFVLVPAFRAGAFRQRGLQPEEHAGQRVSRPLHRRRGAGGHPARAAAGGDRLFPLPADDLPLCDQEAALDLRRAIRRRHLDDGRAGELEARHRRGGQSRDPDRLPHRPDAEEFYRQHPVEAEPRRDRLRGPPLPRRDQEPLRRHRSLARRFRRPVVTRRLPDRREIRLHARGDGKLYARARARRRALRHHVEQGRAAEERAQALRDDGGGRPRRRFSDARALVLRRLELPLLGHGALQERRLQRRRDRDAARPHAKNVVRRDLLSRHAGRHDECRQDLQGLHRAAVRRRCVARRRDRRLAAARGRPGCDHRRADGRGPDRAAGDPARAHRLACDRRRRLG